MCRVSETKANSKTDLTIHILAECCMEDCSERASKSPMQDYSESCFGGNPSFGSKQHQVENVLSFSNAIEAGFRDYLDFMRLRRNDPCRNFISLDPKPNELDHSPVWYLSSK